jgi:hypothetical protein
MLSVPANNIHDGNSSYRPLPRPGCGDFCDSQPRRVLPQRVHVAPLIEFRRVKWAVLLPLVFVADITVAAIVWYVVNFLIR